MTAGGPQLPCLLRIECLGMVGNEAHSFQSQENEFPTYVNNLPMLPSNKAYFRWAVFRFGSFCMEHMEHEQITTSIRSGQGTNHHWPFQEPIYWREYPHNSYGQTYGTFTYLHKLDPGDLPLKSQDPPTFDAKEPQLSLPIHHEFAMNSPRTTSFGRPNQFGPPKLADRRRLREDQAFLRHTPPEVRMMMDFLVGSRLDLFLFKGNSWEKLHFFMSEDVLKIYFGQSF